MRRFLVLAGASLIGCSNLTGACTLIGCDNHLRIAFETPPSGAVRVEALEEGATSPRVVECASASACPFGATFQDFTPAHVIITVITDQGSKQFDLRPAYEQIRPNGRNCGPVCTQARVVVSLP